MSQWMHSLPVTLALSEVELIIYGVGAIIVVGSWIANLVKQNAEKQKREQRMARPSQLPGAGASLDDLAARRREELRRMAQQRRPGGAASGGGVSGGAASGGGGEPANLTMAERIERARAQEAYRQRAEALRQQQQAASAPPAGPQGAPTQEDPAQVLAERRRREAAESLRQRQEAMERARRERDEQVAVERRRREAAARQRQAQAKSAQQQRTPRQQPSQRRPPQRVQPPARPVVLEPEVQTLHMLDKAHLIDEQARRSAPARQAGKAARREPAIQGRQLGILLTNAQSFRQALILKEVLDKPLAMRDPDADRFFA